MHVQVRTILILQVYGHVQVLMGIVHVRMV